MDPPFQHNIHNGMQTYADQMISAISTQVWWIGHSIEWLESANGHSERPTGTSPSKRFKKMSSLRLTTEEILIELSRNRIEYGSKWGTKQSTKMVANPFWGGCFLTHTYLGPQNAFHAMQIISRSLNHEPCKDGWNREVPRVFRLYRPQHIKHFKNPQNHEVLPRITCLKRHTKSFPTACEKKAIP